MSNLLREFAEAIVRRDLFFYTHSVIKNCYWCRASAPTDQPFEHKPDCEYVKARAWLAANPVGEEPKKERLILKPYSVLTVTRGDRVRHYEISGVHLGATSEESVVTMRPWTKVHRDIPGTEVNDELVVPEFFIEALGDAGQCSVKEGGLR